MKNFITTIGIFALGAALMLIAQDAPDTGKKKGGKKGGAAKKLDWRTHSTGPGRILFAGIGRAVAALWRRCFPFSTKFMASTI